MRKIMDRRFRQHNAALSGKGRSSDLSLSAAQRKDRPERRSGLPAHDLGVCLYRDDASKISFILEAPDDARQAPGRQRRAGAVNLGVPGTDKGTAVKRMLAAISGSVAETIAFGDAAVDVPMLRTCAINVAMGSGGEQARMAAAHVTDYVERDGLAKAFAHFGLI